MDKISIVIFIIFIIPNAALAQASEKEKDRDLSLVVDEMLVKRGALRKSLSFSFKSEVDASDDFLGLSKDQRLSFGNVWFAVWLF